MVPSSLSIGSRTRSHGVRTTPPTVVPRRLPNPAQGVTRLDGERVRAHLEVDRDLVDRGVDRPTLMRAHDPSSSAGLRDNTLCDRHAAVVLSYRYHSPPVVDSKLSAVITRVI